MCNSFGQPGMILIHLNHDRVRVMVLNATFKNISAISWMVRFIGGGNRSTWKKTPTCPKSLTKFITWCCIEYTLPWVGFNLKMLVVIGTDYIGSCKSNYLMITTMTTPYRCINMYHTETFKLIGNCLLMRIKK